MPTLFQFLYNQLVVGLPKPTTDVSGKTVIVTGSNVGLGKEAARILARNKASKVVLAVRSLEKGEAAKKDIEQSTGSKGVVEVWYVPASGWSPITLPLTNS